MVAGRDQYGAITNWSRLHARDQALGYSREFGNILADHEQDGDEPAVEIQTNVVEVRPSSLAARALVVGTVIMFAVFAYTGQLPISSLSSTSSSSSSSSSVSSSIAGGIDVVYEEPAPTWPEFRMTCANEEYMNMGFETFPYPFLRNASLMEPYRPHLVSLFNAFWECDQSWTMTHAKDPSVVFSGFLDSVNRTADPSFHVVPSKTGKYVFRMNETCYGVNGLPDRTFEHTVYVKYIRRELSYMARGERDEFLDALKTLWDVSTKDGIEKYGPDYKSLNYLAMIHNDGSGNGVCDEFENGSGFMYNNILLGMYLEQSMRLVNPRVSLHYSEYAKYFSSDEFKGHVYNQMDGGSWAELMTSDYFGSSNPLTGEIMDGRWAGVEVPFIDDTFYDREMVSKEATFFPDEEWEWLQIQPVHLTSPYGFLRAPWNYNPSQKLARFNNMNEVKDLAELTTLATTTYLGSTCSDYQTFVKEYAYGQPFETYLDNIEAKTVSNVYFAIGGSGGSRAAEVDAELRGTFGFSDDDILYLAKGGQSVYKTYIPRKKSTSVDPPVKCSDDPYWDGEVFITQQPGELGGPICDCNPALMQDNASIATLFGNWNVRSPDFLTALPLEQEQQAMSLICGRMSYDGELATSAAPLDPIFWVLHGAAERLYQSVVFGALLKVRACLASERARDCVAWVPVPVALRTY